MSIEELISQIGGNIEGIQRGKREWEYGQYGGDNPRFQQEITNFTTRWENVFNFLDINDSAAIDRAYTALDEDYQNYVRKYPEKMFDYDLVKNEVTEMLDAFKGRGSEIQAGKNKLGELRTTLESYLDADTVDMMINDYASGNKDKDNKDFRNHFVSNIAGIDKTVDDITRSLYLTTAQDTEGQSYHKLRNNRFFNENLVGIDDDTLVYDIASAKDYIKALKGEMMTGVDAMLLLDSGDPWTAANQGVSSAENMPYELRWNVTHDEAAQLKMVLDGDIKQTEYDKQESLELKQRQLAKQDVIENLKPSVNTYNHINSIISFAEQVNQKPWAKIGGGDPLNLVKTDGTPYLYKELKGKFTDEVLGGNYKLLPAEIRSALEAQAKLHPENPIALTKDLVQFWREQNLDAITDEDARYFKNWDDKESDYPFPVELQNPDIYPQGLKNLLRGDDVRWSRKSSKYGQYGTVDYVSLNQDTGILNMDDVNVANLASASPVKVVDEFEQYDVKEGDLDPDDISKITPLSKEIKGELKIKNKKISDLKQESYTYNKDLEKIYDGLVQDLSTYESEFEGIIDDGNFYSSEGFKITIPFFDNDKNREKGTYYQNVGHGGAVPRISPSYIPTDTELAKIQKSWKNYVQDNLDEVIRKHGPNGSDPQPNLVLEKEEWAKKQYLRFNKWKDTIPALRDKESDKEYYEETQKDVENKLEELNKTVKEKRLETTIKEAEYRQTSLNQGAGTTWVDKKSGKLYMRPVGDPTGIQGQWVEVPDISGLKKIETELVTQGEEGGPLKTEPADYMAGGKYTKMPSLKKRAVDMIFKKTIGQNIHGIVHTASDGDSFVIESKKSITDWVKNASKEDLMYAIIKFENPNVSQEDIDSLVDYLIAN